MMKYDEQSSSNSIPNLSESFDDCRADNLIQDEASFSSTDNSISLTQLWKYVVKYKKLPDDLDINTVFAAINQKLRNPEWEVRQHALRVTSDIIKFINSEDLDSKIENILNDIVRNLGHIGPAVRKAAVDTLKTYLSCSRKPNSVLRELVAKGVENAAQNKVNSNISLGIIIAIPFLINPKISIDALGYVIHVLLDKLGQILHQETILRSILRIKGIIGSKQLNEILETHKFKREFEMLCELYNLPEPNACDFALDFFYSNDHKHIWNDYNQNLVQSQSNNKEEQTQSLDKVILETEIKLDEGQAITMKIHEETRQNSFNSSDSEEESRGIRTFKVLADDSDDEYEMLRKTPRRVRFGGEIVKMRTPDSDSNNPSDGDETLIINTKQTNPLIEIRYKSTTSKSHIPIPISSKHKPVKSEPNSPRKINCSKLYTSSPNLSRDYIKTSKSRIPRKNNTERTEITKSIKIKVNNTTKTTKREDHPRKFLQKKEETQIKNVEDKIVGRKVEAVTEENKKPVLEYSPKTRDDKDAQKENQAKINVQNVTPPKSKQNTGIYSPIPIHNEIELFHNLTRSPERKLKKDEDAPEERRLTTADDVLFEKLPSVNERKIHTADFEKYRNTNNQLVFINTYNSFHVYNANGNNMVEEFDSPIPTKDTGECLTCSSSGSDVGNDKNGCDCVGLVNQRIVCDVQNRDDVRIKQRGLEELLKSLKDETILNSVEDKLPFLLNILFSSEQQPILQSISEQNLSYLFTNLAEETIINKMQQIAYNLSKTGSPVGVRLALTILKRIPAKYLIDQLLNESILGAKSSKIREGALQILMSMSRIFPSTDMDIPKCVDCVVRVLKDKKRKVRQAALETIAALAQLSSTSVVLDVVTKIIEDYSDKEQILRVVRTRLSRKQLPAVDLNGNVRYSTPSGETELEWLSQVTNSSAESQTCRSYNENQYASGGSNKSAPLSDTRTNYWIQKKDTARIAERTLTDIDWDSRDTKDESLNKTSQSQIWAIDPNTIYTSPDKSNQVNGTHREKNLNEQKNTKVLGTLRPVFIIQPDSQASLSSESYSNGTIRYNKQTNTDNKEFRYNRGRSFSPPKRENRENDRFIQTDNVVKEKFYKSDNFRKSFSSDQLLQNPDTNSRNSGSSSTSGSSLRSGVWNKDIKSGIPIPINTDGRFKLRSKFNDVRGPVTSAQYYSTKIQSPDATPDKFLPQTRPIMARQPFSSGSESSGYFTPPTEPHLPEIFDQYADNSRLKSSQSERFVQTGTPSIRQENFTVIDSNYCENLKSKSAPVHYPSLDSVDFQHSKAFGESVERISSSEEKFKDSLDEDDIVEENTEELQKNLLTRQSTVQSFEDLDFVANQTFGERKLLSKSEANINTTVESTRKTVNSAPVINKSFEGYTPYDDTPTSSTKTSLPGSIVDFHEIEVVQEVIEESPTKTICKKTITRQLSRKRSIKMIKTEDDPSGPFLKPKESLSEVLNQLENSEWETTMQGLQAMVRLVKHHQGIIESHMHAVCVALGKHVRNLRSQVSRAACSVCSELFKTCKKSVEMELEELACPLLHRTADTNKFLRSDANAALDDMCLNLSPPKVVTVITTRGSTHQNAIVRCASVRLLCALTHRLGTEKTFQLPKDTRDRILLTGANMLTEGSLETRKHAKMLLGRLAEHSQFQKAMLEAVPSHIMRQISKTLQSLM